MIRVDKQQRNWLRVLLTLPILLLVLLSAAQPLDAQTNEGAVVGEAIFQINIRSAPGVTSPVISSLQTGEEVIAVGRNASNSWIQIEQGSTVGWVASWLMIFSRDTLDLNVTTDFDPPPTSGSGPFEGSSPFTINLRSLPGVEGQVLGSIRFLETVDVTARSQDNSWVFVEFGENAGWAAAWLLVIDGDTLGLPILDPTGGGITIPVFGTPDASETPVATATPTATPRVSPTPSATPRPGVTVTPDPDAEAVLGTIAVSSPFRVNIRSEPDQNAPVIGVIPNNAQASAVGRTFINNWVQVDYRGTVGWVANWIVTSNLNMADLPVTSLLDRPVTFTGPITATTRFNTSVRSGPNEAFGQIASLTSGEEVTLSARTELNDWFLIEFGGTQGWIAGWLVVASQDSTNLRVVEQ